MEKIIFLNVGWMSKYSGPGPITGGGKYVTTHGYGHEMLNFKPFAGKMYGTAVVPHYGALNLGKLGAAQGAEFVDGVLVVWVAQSRIVGWYINARVYRRSQSPPQNSSRSYNGKPIRYLATAKASNCRLLIPDERHFWVPRARERKKAMGRYVWYAEGVPNRAFRSKVLNYVVMNKPTRRKLHAAINDLSHDEVAAIVRQEFPRAKGLKIDALAKAAIASAHRQVSPRLPRKTR